MSTVRSHPVLTNAEMGRVAATQTGDLNGSYLGGSD